MATLTKQKGIAKKDVKKKLAEQVVVKPTPVAQSVKVEKPIISLETRIQKFEQLRGLAGKRERLNATLNNFDFLRCVKKFM